jgi:hypothetical protein
LLMQATVTADFELILRWRDRGETTVCFALASPSEFTITTKVCWLSSLNYQGETSVSFQTMCYGYDLDQFAFELRRMSVDRAGSAGFLNTGGDFEIRIVPDERVGKRVLLSEVRYRPCRVVGDVSCKSELVLPVGVAEDVSGTAQAIVEIIRLLKIDCSHLMQLRS